MATQAISSAVYTVRVMKDGRTVMRKQVSTGLGRSDAVVVKAAEGVVYVLGDAITNAAPASLTTKRVGKNLHLTMSKGSPDVPDLIIEGYFDFPPAPVMGTLENGGLANYDLGQAVAGASAAAPSSGDLGSGSSLGSSLAGGSVSEATLPGAASGGMFSGWTLAILGGGLALAGGGGGSSSGAGASAAASPDAATAAQSKLSSYANDSTQAVPVPGDYTALGVTGVTSGNVAAINTAIDALISTQVDSKAKVQAVVDAYVKILAEANGALADATPAANPLASDYAAIGANIGLASSNSAALSLLNDVVAGQATTAVDTVTEINALAAVVDKIMNTAAGGAGTLTVPELALLGLATVGAGAVNTVNIAAINTAINALSTSGGQSKVDTYSELFNLVNAVATIVNYANDNTQSVPTEAQYGFAGITGVTASNLGAINSAVDAKVAVDVDSKTKLQSIVDTYVLILAEANGAAADATPASDPTAANYAAIGANIGAAATNMAGLSLLNDAIDGLVSTAIDTIAEINALANAVNAVMTGAAGGTKPTLAQLGLMGVTGVTSDNLSAIQNAIAATADSGLQVDTMAELQSVVTTAVNAASASLTVISNYAASSANPAPVQTDFTNMAVTGVTAGNVAAIDSAIDALASTAVNAIYKVQKVVTAYVGILAEANGAAADAIPDNPVADDYAAIGALAGLALGGIAGGTDNASNALALLNNSIGGKLTADVDTVSEINVLAAIVDKVMNLAGLTTGDAIPIGALTVAELNALGVDTALADTGAEEMAIQQAILDSSNSGSGVATILALQAIVNAHAA